MVNVFVYHKNPETTKIIYDSVTEYFRRIKHTFQIFASSKENEAAAYLKENASTVNIFFLDFGKFEQSLKFIAYFRQRNESATWVHMGNIESLLKTLYYRPSAFLDDAGDIQKIEKIIKCLDGFWQKKITEEYFNFKYDGERVSVKYDDIIYFESNAKRVIPHIIKAEREYYFAAKLSEIEQVLPDYFLRCHQSYIVNMKKIKKMSMKNHSFIMEDNDEIYISKRMFTEAKKRYIEFSGE